ncbi:hypothetical protein KHA93_05685 [Bacillus sp. FJAT-49732]|uniref:Uncharacterized protein n=1 Tax=Lederbergia citrisecunda TaxID=2833583 RepID=A0A942YL07_9BACI|nr:hypothetical protein [Lederbergia citrisecunda]MBS4199145.1 hypothetical protein [Lederbergia citrisecunda]
MKETNTKSILALILAILSFFVPTRGIVFATIGVAIATISFVLSIKSLEEIRRFKQVGKWFARSAFIFSIVSVLLHSPNSWSIDKILP